MRLVAVRAPLKLLGTGQRHIASSSANKNDRGACQEPAATVFLFEYKTIFLGVYPASVLGVQHKILRHGVTSDIKQHLI